MDPLYATSGLGPLIKLMVMGAISNHGNCKNGLLLFCLKGCTAEWRSPDGGFTWLCQ